MLHDVYATRIQAHEIIWYNIYKLRSADIYVLKKKKIQDVDVWFNVTH